MYADKLNGFNILFNNSPLSLHYTCIVSLTLKLKQELRCLTKKDANIWDDQLIVHNFRMVMNDDVLKDIVEGLRLGDNLKLYRNVSLNVQQMSDLFASNKCIHPFTQLR